MSSRRLLVLVLGYALPVFGQTASPSQQKLPKDPEAILAAASPHYNFNDLGMKPWNLKATYQIYDEKGNASAQGKFEYWWASPTVHRIGWSRSGASLTLWATADGKRATLRSGEPLDSYENRIQDAFVSPLPALKENKSSLFHTLLREVKIGRDKLPCIFVVPPLRDPAPATPSDPSLLLAMYPAYCFDPHLPAVRFTSIMGREATQFNNLIDFQNKYLAKEIVFANGPHKRLVVTVDSIELTAEDNPAFTPAQDAEISQKVPIQFAAEVTGGKLIKRIEPDYPLDAKDRGISGAVVLQATVGIDGAVHKTQVLESPMPSLAAAAEQAVLQWRYEPFLLHGAPVETVTVIRLNFTLHK